MAVVVRCDVSEVVAWIVAMSDVVIIGATLVVG